LECFDSFSMKQSIFPLSLKSFSIFPNIET
jgi:hypothetical protein